MAKGKQIYGFVKIAITKIDSGLTNKHNLEHNENDF